MPALTSITTGQNNKEAQVNENFLACSVGACFGVRAENTTGLNLGLWGGILVVDGALLNVANPSPLAMTSSTTNYVSISRTGAFNVNTSAFLVGNIPLWEIVTDGSGITARKDRRAFAQRQFPSRLSKAVTSADVTLTAHEIWAEMIITTGTLTGNRSLIVPAQIGEWLIHNTCTGAFTLTVKTPSGTGVVIPQQRRVRVMCDGTNVVVSETYTHFQDIAYAASITPDLSLGTTIIVGALTGNITINAPTNRVKGERITFIFTQDGTGGHTITWNAVFKKAADGAGTANQVGSTQFVSYDGTNLVQIGGALTFFP